MRKLQLFLFPAFAVAMPVWVLHAQCPFLYNCPQGSPVICDLSPNDPLLWADAPYTWSQANTSSDLYEGTVEFSLKILPCVGGGNVDVSYTLLLDLDNDNLRETAVSSLQFPPAGIVYAGNAFNPGYAGGEPLEFDKRLVQDSLKFRFALEISPSWDTLVARLCWQSGSINVSPRLPEGRHHLIWRIEQDGVVKYCEHSFRLKDCQPPTLECAPEWNVSLDTNGMAILYLNDIFVEAEDNATPFPLLEFSMRHSDDGTGFPLDSADNPVTTLTYDCEMLDTQVVELWVRDRSGNTTSCATTVVVTDDSGTCNKPPVLCASTFWGPGDIVKPVTYKMLWVDTSQKLIEHPLPLQGDGCGLLDALPPAGSFSLVAECDTNPLNGVSTFDLLLISKHILGVQIFDAPWKWLAADANNSGSVTTFDIVELRKLILGIYDQLPANTSWQFYTADCDFSANPFESYCPSEYSFTTLPLWNYPAEIPFLALKTGDVNGTANPVSFSHPAMESREEQVSLLLPDMELQRGKVYEIPVRATETGEWYGLQLALQFDPELIAIERVVTGILPALDEHSWAQPQPGKFNLCWFDALPHTVLPGDPLFNLRVRVLKAARLSDALSLSTERLKSEVYEKSNSASNIQLRFFNHFDPNISPALFPPQPNPTHAGVVIPFRLPGSETVIVEIADLSGKIVFQAEQYFEKGSHLLELPTEAFPGAGMYLWRLKAGNFTESGEIVRL